MPNVVRVAKRLVPVEHIALFEPFVPSTNPDYASRKAFASRIVLLDKMSILAEQTVEELAQANRFRLVEVDRAALNPNIMFQVEAFEPTEGFKPAQAFLTRLIWHDQLGNTQSKLLLAEPEHVLALVARKHRRGGARKVRSELFAVGNTGDAS